MLDSESGYKQSNILKNEKWLMFVRYIKKMEEKEGEAILTEHPLCTYLISSS